MSRLPSPIGEALRSPVDEAFVRSVWERVDRPRGVRARAPWAIAAILAAGLLVAVWPAPSPKGVRVLRHGDARVFSLTSSDVEASLLLESGRATFEVDPAAHRRVTVDAGLARVEVVGTKFTVERTADSVHVSVERGVVRVRSRLLLTRAALVAAGHDLTIRAVATDSVLEPAAETEPIAAPPISPRVAPEVVVVPAAAPAAPQPVGRTPEEVASPPMRVEPDAEVDVVAALLAEADHLRAAGDPGRARERLVRVVTEYASDPRAALAAFSLGRVEPSARAGAWFERAIDLGLPEALEHDAYKNAFDAYVRAGAKERAERVARRYLATHADGRYAKAASAVLGE